MTCKDCKHFKMNLDGEFFSPFDECRCIELQLSTSAGHNCDNCKYFEEKITED